MVKTRYFKAQRNVDAFVHEHCDEIIAIYPFSGYIVVIYKEMDTCTKA